MHRRRQGFFNSAAALLAGVCAASLAAPSLADSFYFDASARGGGNGTRSSPFNSITAANSLNLDPGDHLYLRGTFNTPIGLSLDSKDAGTAANPVVITSLGSTPATINAGDSFGLQARNVGGIDVSNLRFVGSGHAAGGGSSRDSTGLYTNDNDGIGFYADQGVKPNHIRIDKVYVAGFGENGITIHGENGKSGFNDVRITNSVAEYNQRSGVNADGDFNGAGRSAHTNVYVGNVRANNNAGRPNRPNENNSGSGIILGQVNGATIENSVAYANGTACASTQGGAVGIWAWDSNKVVIQNNESYKNGTAGQQDGGGFDLDGGVTNSVMQNNYSHDNDGAGYLLAEFSGAKQFANNVVRNNVSENDGRKNGYGAIHAFGPIGNTEVSDNTVIMSPADAKKLRPDGEPPAAVKFRDASGKDITFKDNLFVLTDKKGSGKTVEPVMVDLSGASGADFQGNAFYQIDGSAKKLVVMSIDSDPDPSADGAGGALSTVAAYVNDHSSAIQTPSSRTSDDASSPSAGLTREPLPHTAIPEPTGVSLLTLIAAGAVTRRRRRNEAVF